MNEPAQQDTQAQDQLGDAVNAHTDLDSFKATQQDLVNRHSDAVAKITEAEDEIHNLERNTRKWKDHLAWQVKRRDALARRIRSSREYIRAAEDDASGVY